MSSFRIGYIHYSCHKFNRFEIPHNLYEQVYSFLSLIPKEDMRIFIDDLDDCWIFNIFKIVQSFLVGLLGKIVHDDHLKIVFLIRKID
jgi:hypothetical protein